MTETPEGVVVTQADRDAASKVMISREAREAAAAGKIDDNGVVQAFARHRLAHTAAPRTEEVERLIAELQPLIDKAAGPNGWDYMFPLRVNPVDGKPTIVSHRGGNLFRGYIATWNEADLLVALANAAPRILAALASLPPSDVHTRQGVPAVVAQWPDDLDAERREALTDACMIMAKYSADPAGSPCRDALVILNAAINPVARKMILAANT